MACSGSGVLDALHTAQSSSEMTNFQSTCAAHEEQVSADTEACAVPEPLASTLGSVWCPWRAPGAVPRTLWAVCRSALK
ncbi:hypothetical protein T484DRAFT_2520147 [Baffinella frigidus]|nr:hypothetical protein T484DRAFT_2520147 [Cryptophyta sp. CCMP2293]